MQKWREISLRQEEYSIDEMPTRSVELRFDGSVPQLAGGEAIEFINPETSAGTIERVRLTTMLGTNGSYLFTPAACDDKLQALDVDAVKPERLEGQALVIDFDEAISHGVEEIRAQLLAKGVALEPQTVPEFIVFFRTGVMKKITDGNKPKERPGITPEGAVFLAELNLAKAYGIDSQSFEVMGHTGFPATQRLLRANTDSGDFTPVIYQLANLDEVGDGDMARIEIGNAPYNQPSWPVRVMIKTA